MIDSALYHRLMPITRRFQLRRLFLTLAVIWSIATCVGLMFWWLKIEGIYYSPLVVPVLLVIKLLATVIGLAFALRSNGEGDYEQAALQIERRFPDLDASLVTAVEQHPRSVNGSLGFLQQEVVRKAVYHGYQNSWAKVIPQWQMFGLPMLAALGLLAFCVAVLGNFLSPFPENSGNGAAVVTGEWVANAQFGDFVVEPGDIEVEKFSSLMVLAKFAAQQLPTDAQLVMEDETGETKIQAMNKSLGDPVFGARIGSVKGPLNYRIRCNGEDTESFQVTVFEFPKLLRADARMEFPQYTQKESKFMQDVRRISGVSGTRVTWILTLNKPIESGRLIAKDGQQIWLLPSPDDPNQYLAEMTLQRSVRFQVELVDTEERENRSPPTLSVQVTGNEPPEIKQLSPAADAEVSPVEELTLSATFWDDFGLLKTGVTYSLVGKEEKEITLGSDIGGKQRDQGDFILSFEDLKALPNQLLTFYFWAEDQDANGKSRRTLGDIHLVTVRDFESIFRQGQQNPSGQGNQGGQGGQGDQGGPQMELAELQRNIVYAIWNLSRREMFETVTETFVGDVAVIAESQNSAIEMLDQQAAMAEDAEQQATLAKARGYMQETVSHLQTAFQDEASGPLSQALVAAQKADQALLELRSLESDVVQNQQQQQSGGGGGNRQQRQQMQQLQLENDENRYAEEQTAEERNETNEDRENRQVLSRLRELARRQNDLNERIKELQSSLEEAETNEEREEIEERLKRLREEQQQILRDTEDLQERMENPENQKEMSEQAEQLEQARESARQSSDALQEGDVTRAAAEGTRALRNMEELRDEFQNRSAGQFDQQVQRLRNEARDIEKEQQDIAREMEQAEEQEVTPEKRLSDDPPENDLEDRLSEQSTKLESLREDIRETIEEAEEFEPILAEKLYDAYRRTQQESPSEAIDSTRQSLRRGFVDDAQREQRRAARGITRLREDIDEAAESILGDETDALRRANREIERLVDAVEQERERANPEQTDSNSEDSATANSAAEDAERQANSTAESQSDRAAENAGGGRGSPPNEEAAASGQGTTEEETNPSETPSNAAGESATGSSEGAGGGGRNRPNNQPSLRGREGQDQRGWQGANPEINYGEESWNNPLTGDDFMDWSDRMRDVEEMVADPELRGEAAKIREDARAIRRDFKEGSGAPNWELIRLKVIEPMVQLQDRVQEELIRRSGDKSMVPVDRDPVPAEFESGVQSYFEKLGRGK